METGRLILGPLGEEHLDELVALDNDPEVMRFLTGGKPRTPTEVEAAYRARFEHGDYWAATEKTSGLFVGWFALSAFAPDTLELGYRLQRKAWGMGYATEGSLAILGLAFDRRGVNRVIARTMAVNQRSRRVMERIGMRFVRTLHERFDDPLPGTELGEVEYEISRT